MRYLLLFFIVAPPLPSTMGWTFAVTTAGASTVLLLEPGQGAAAVMPILVLQLFAAASGFSGSARRGYYDLLFTSGESRIRVAVAHWFMSINLGVAAWLTLGLVELAVMSSPAPAILSTGTAAAMLVLSTLPWALAVAQPRFAASISWLLLLTMGAVVVPGGDTEGWLQSLPAGVRDFATAAVFLVYPPAMVGRALAGTDLPFVLPGIGVSLSALAGAWGWIGHADVPLEASQ